MDFVCCTVVRTLAWAFVALRSEVQRNRRNETVGSISSGGDGGVFTTEEFFSLFFGSAHTDRRSLPSRSPFWLIVYGGVSTGDGEVVEDGNFGDL